MPGMKSLVLFVVLAAALSLTLLLAVNAMAQARDPNYEEGGSGGSCPSGCNYCCQESCGCSSPPPGTVLTFDCSCSSIQCTRSCTYTSF